MELQLNLLISALRSIATIQKRTRAAIFKSEIEKKFLHLGIIHSNFLETSITMEKTVAKADDMLVSNNITIESLSEIILLLKGAETLRRGGADARRLLWAEARYMCDNDDALVFGPIKTFTDKEEFLIKKFFREVARYFSQSGDYEYSHELQGLFVPFTLSIERIHRNLLRKSLSSEVFEGATKSIRNKSGEIRSILKQLHLFQERINNEWCLVIRAYVEVRQALLPQRSWPEFLDQDRLLEISGISHSDTAIKN